MGKVKEKMESNFALKAVLGNLLGFNPKGKNSTVREAFNKKNCETHYRSER